jgi:peptidoglycan/xylan/chitin deacetylase (PgdA/CDA1 family)
VPSSTSIRCYHSVDAEWKSPLAVTPSLFREHCSWLRRRRTVVPALDLLEARQRGHRTRGVVAITFDDGFADFVDGAAPALVENSLPATMFLVAGTLDEGNGGAVWLTEPTDHPPATLTEDAVLQLLDQGVSFGSHTWAHRDLRDSTEDECLRDLRDSRERLEDLLRRPVPLLAYPYGFHSAHVRRAAERAGYRYALSLPQGPEPRGPLAAPRVGVYRRDSTLAVRAKASPFYLPLRMNPLYARVRPGSVTLAGPD